mgnify:CR=1 FL=1
MHFAALMITTVMMSTGLIAAITSHQVRLSVRRGHGTKEVVCALYQIHDEGVADIVGFGLISEGSSIQNIRVGSLHLRASSLRTRMSFSMHVHGRRGLPSLQK